MKTDKTPSSLGHVQQLWNEWEMQCLVLTSFALQAFLLFSAGVRKSSSSGAIRLLLWLAYLLADSLAIFILGHLALHAATTVHRLLLFWPPFLLHHLGGQETITAFSVEDNALWKRHLLSLVSQEAMAVYVAAKSWRTEDGLLAASTALMFVSGTVKYAERTYALKCANAMALGTKFTTPFLLDDPILSMDGVCALSGYFNWMEIDKNDYAQLVRKAYSSLGLYMNLLMDMPRSWLSDDYGSMPDACSKLQADPDRACKSYKLVELQLSLIYDYLYTKIGMRHCHLNPLAGAALQAVTFISTSGALVLFMVAGAGHHHHDYSRADVVVSYVLLVGAVVLEVSSAVILVSSYWTYCGVDEFCVAKGISRSCADVIFGLVKRVRPASRRMWSGKLARYDLIRGCIQEKQASVVGRAIRWIGVDCDTTHVVVSGELKELVLDKLIGTGANWMELKDFVKFRGERALALAAGGSTEVLRDSVSNVDFPTSVLVWHAATDICFFSSDDDPPAPHRHRGPSKELSDYLMYLVAKCDVLRSSSSRFSLDKALKAVKENLAGDDRRRHAREMLETEKYDGDQSTLLASRAVARCLVNNVEDAAERWELIAAVWLEMLCYLAPRCTAKFHATHLSTGGEFLTHVRTLMINLGLAWEIRPKW
ncbi:unnamed protein product [Alopecurus aequalis]